MKPDPLVTLLRRLDAPLLSQVLALEAQYQSQKPESELTPESQAEFNAIVNEVLQK